MNRLVNGTGFIIIIAAALYFIGCSNHTPVATQVDPFDQADLSIDTNLVGTWKAQGAFSGSNLTFITIPLDSETTVTMTFKADKTVEFSNPSHSIDQKGTWGVTVDRILVVNRSINERIASNYSLESLDTGLKGLIFTEYFNFTGEKGFAVFTWAKM